MGTQKLYLAFGLFVITYYHCFKIPTFSLWKYCFLWNPPCRAECFLQHRRYFEESLFCDSSILNTLWMKNLENQCSTLRKYSCSAQGAIIFFLISDLSRTIKEIVTYIQMLGFLHWWQCYFSFICHYPK